MKSINQLANIFTKAVSEKIFHEAIDKLGMIDIYEPTSGELLTTRDYNSRKFYFNNIYLLLFLYVSYLNRIIPKIDF